MQAAQVSKTPKMTPLAKHNPLTTRLLLWRKMAIDISNRGIEIIQHHWAN
jgi:hypothetical protein